MDPSQQLIGNIYEKKGGYSMIIDGLNGNAIAAFA
jgi:hypothetical protein